MTSLFRNRFYGPAASRRRRSRTLPPAMPLERLEPRLALANHSITQPMLEQASTLVMDSSMGPNPVVMSKAQVVGNDVKSFVISHVPEGSVVEKWDAIKEQWVDVSTMPTSSNPQELMQLLSNRFIQEGDKIQWRPKAGVAAAAQQAFEMIGWDDGTELTAPTDAVPSTVLNLSLEPTGVGEFTASWTAPASGNVTNYTVTLTTQSGKFKPETAVYVTSNLSYKFTDLSPANSYTVSVTAHAEGGSASQQGRFGSTIVTTNSKPGGITMSSDGSIWFTLPYRNNVQQLKHNGETWTLQTPINVGEKPHDVAGSSDGSIWVTNTPSNSVQQIKQVGTDWVAQPALPTRGPSPPYLILSSPDGSVWFTTEGKVPYQQITLADGVWAVQTQTYFQNASQFQRGGQAGGLELLAIAPDGSLFTGDNVSYIRQWIQDNGTWQIQPLIPVLKNPFNFTVGLDGALWVGGWGTNDHLSISRATQTNGEWQVQSTYETQEVIPRHYFPMITGLDGSIWFTNLTENTVTQLKAQNGDWMLQSPLDVGNEPLSLTTGQDGSIWLTNEESFTVQQIIAAPSAPEALGVILGSTAAGGMTLSWQPPQFSGGGEIIEYTATATQGDETYPITTSDLSCVFDGLIAGNGPTYFTVKATNFAGLSQAASFQIDTSGNAFSTENMSVGFTTDGTPLTYGGGFDGQGNTFSWDAMADAAAGGTRVGTDLSWAGVTFDLGAPNAPSFVRAVGQDLTAEELGIENAAVQNVLNILAASANGSSAVTFQVNFTDGTSVNWDQTVSDWCTPSTEQNQFIASTQSYRNTAAGVKDATENYLYAYSLKIPEGKVFESISLPNNPQLGIFDVQMTSSLPVFTSMLVAPNVGYTGYGLVVGNNNTNNGDGFDGNGNYYNVGSNGNSIGELIWGGSPSNYNVNGLSWGGAFFELGPAPNNAPSARNPAYNNVMQAQGQLIILPFPGDNIGQQSALLVIGAAANGNQTNQDFRVLLTDAQGTQSSANWTLSFTDWRNNNGSNNNPPPTQQQLAATGEVLVAQTNVVNKLGNNQMKENAFVYGYTYEVPAGKTVIAIEFPTNENVGILAISTVWQN
jgi:streptogramin lyase